MLAELQISTDVFEAALRDQIRRMIPPIDLQFADPTDGRLSLIDHIDVAPDTLISVTRHAAPTPVTVRHGGTVTVSACRIHLEQSIDVVVAAIEDLKVANADPLPAGQYRRYTLPMFFDVIAGFSASGAPQLCIHFARIGVPSPELAALVSSRVRDVCTPFDVSALSALLGYRPYVSNIGISTDDDTTFFALRLELQDPVPDTVARWSAFWDGPLVPRIPAGAGWALAVDGETVTPALERKVADGILASKELDLKTFPTVELTDTADGIALIVRFGGNVAAKSCIIEVDVTLTGSLALAGANLVSVMHADWDASDWDVIKCALKIALAGMLDGFVIGGTFGGFPAAIGGALAGAAIGFFGVIGIASLYKPSLPPPAKGCTKLADYDYQCTFPALGGVAAGPLGTLAATALHTDGGGGLVFSGTVALRETAAALMSVSTADFGWGFIDVCSAGALHNWADLSIANLGVHALAFTTPREYGDPLDNFRLAPPDPSPVLAHSFVQWKLFSDMRDDYLALATHYPAELLIVSNGGARYLTIAGPPTPTAAELATLKLAEELEREAHCKTPIMRVFGGDPWEPAWLGDPAPPPGFPGGDPPYGPWVHGSHVFVGGAGPWGELVLEDSQGAVLATGLISDGWAELTVGLTALQGVPDVRLRLAGQGTRLPVLDDGGRVVAIGQALFQPVGAFALAEPCFAIAAARGSAGAIVTVATASGVARYDVGEPLAPRLVERFVLEGVRGARIESGAIVLHTDEHSYVQRGREPLVRAGRAAATHAPNVGDHVAPAEVAELVPVIGSRGRRLVFARRATGGGVLVDVTDPQHPTPRARYAIDPWFVGLARAGTLHARLDASRTHITLYTRTWTSDARRPSPNVLR